jgi:acyl-CoA dehydrogenase
MEFLAGVFLTLLLASLVVVLVTPLRRLLVSGPLLRFYQRSMPEISQTERDALEAGTTWWDAQLFSGAPRWRELLDFPAARMSAAEQAFLDGPAEQACALMDDFRICETQDLTPETWAFLKDQRFFGMVIPAEYGGLGMSQYGHAAVIMKLASRSISGALTVMIPNSVGPGKLLLKYGTDAQKKYYLPRLARGEEMPCFALTAPEAGSDAGAIPDTGVVCRGQWRGKDVIGIRLDFNKRYISLGPVATLLGVAFKLRDPEGLLGGAVERGVTLALVPTDLPGVEIGARHKPLRMAFMNGPVRGKDVFIPLEQIIGGEAYVGRGWRMLMECLTDGRAISLPALSTASGKLATRLTGAYARVRSQFKTPIGLFEGIEEPLARIAGHTYAMDAARLVTLAALDAGHKPAVISAIVKYNLTARAQRVIDDAINVHGGAGVMMGPANPLGEYHSFPPMAITVEGHNILTRSLITFGQGAIRCHPYLLAELEAASGVGGKGLAEFDAAFVAHLGHSVGNGVRAVLHGLTDAVFAEAPSGVHPATVAHYKDLTRLSVVFAVATDVLLLAYRGDLKRRERISARMADVISQLYLASASLKHFQDQGARDEDLPLVHWVVKDALHTAQNALFSLFENLDSRLLAVGLRALLFPLGRPFAAPGDSEERQLARAMLQPGAWRDRLTAGMFLPKKAGERLVVLDEAFTRSVATEEAERKLRAALKAKRATGREFVVQVQSAVASGDLSTLEAEALLAADAARRTAIQVDDFGGPRSADAAQAARNA